MPIKIHHGAPGSYKTSGALWDDLLPMCRAGRVVITNARAFSEERCRQQCRELFEEELPDGFSVMFVDTTGPAGKAHLCQWFHWAPNGAFFFIDEIQNIFPKKSKFFDGTGLDCSEEGRPANWLEAWTMHRHWNWDFVLTMQSLTQLRDEIRDVAEACYKHRNNKLIGIPGRYTEGFHLPDTNGTASSHFISVRVRKINKQVFKFYDSTTTGIATDTYAGTPLWKNPRVVLLLACLAGSIGFAFRNGFNNPLHTASSSKTVPVDSPTGNSARPGVHANSVGNSSSDSRGASLAQVPLWKPRMRLSLSWTSGKTVERWYQIAEEDGRTASVPEAQFLQAGYRIEPISDCVVRLYWKDVPRLVDCMPFSQDVKDKGGRK